MAATIFKQYPFLRTYHDQLMTIVNVLGFQELKCFLEKYKIKMDHSLSEQLRAKCTTKLEDYINFRINERTNRMGVDLIRKLLVYDFNERLTAYEALQHPYFLDRNAQEVNWQPELICLNLPNILTCLSMPMLFHVDVCLYNNFLTYKYLIVIFKIFKQ